jgi:tRNA(adenine34) deaminase
LDDEAAMALALDEARAAAGEGEVPVGAVVVSGDGEVIGRGRNRTVGTADPTAHAEVLAIRQAASTLGVRLVGATLYATLEPCPMCAGAIILARVAEVYFGAFDPKAGACGTLMNLLEDPRLNHQPAVSPGLCADECGALLTNFFRRIRGQAPLGVEDQNGRKN